MQTFKNYYCESISCAIGEFTDTFRNFYEEDFLSNLNRDDIDILVKYAIIKNKLAGVDELFIKVPYAGCGVKFLNEFNMKGKEIISAKQINELSAKDFVGDRVMLMIEDLLDYKEGFLLQISDFVARTDMPILISLGRDLEEVGKLVNKYNKSPAVLLEDFGFLDRECYIYGLNFIDKDDQKVFANYNPFLVFSPISDGEEGKGAINLYNFIYNHLKFGFSSGKCYNINMLSEGKLALLNTNNLMYDNNLISQEEILQALTGQVDFKEGINIFDNKFQLDDEDLTKQYFSLRQKVEEIVKNKGVKNGN